MGVAYSYEAPIISARSAVVVIESDECCTMEPCTGRHWDRSLEKPDFVDMSQAEWSSFVSTMHHHVRSYKAEGWAMCIHWQHGHGLVQKIRMGGAGPWGNVLSMTPRSRSGI